MNRFELFDAMVNQKVIELNGWTGYVIRIELEDGSGYCLNVRLRIYATNNYQNIFVRCKA